MSGHAGSDDTTSAGATRRADPGAGQTGATAPPPRPPSDRPRPPGTAAQPPAVPPQPAVGFVGAALAPMRRLKNSRLGTVIGTPDTLPRPPSHASSDAVVAQAQAFLREAGLYIRSYLLIRTCVGIIGVALPFALLIGEATIRGSITARGSISAYYHSSMQSLFV